MLCEELNQGLGCALENNLRESAKLCACFYFLREFVEVLCYLSTIIRCELYMDSTNTIQADEHHRSLFVEYGKTFPLTLKELWVYPTFMVWFVFDPFCNCL